MYKYLVCALLCLALCNAQSTTQGTGRYSNCTVGANGNAGNNCQVGSYCYCANGATCVSPGYDTCDCSSATGYTGNYCEIPVCDNGGCGSGKCVSPGTCDCSGTGYSGARCTVPVCDNCVHGTCVGANTCQCSTGWTNPPTGTAQCSAPVCNPGCAHNGNCSAPNTCDCSTADAGWSGPTCADPVCGSVTCEHGGQCVGPNNCRCAGTGYTGSNCTDDVNECNADPSVAVCQTNCTNTIGNYTCAPCPAGQIGSPYYYYSNGVRSGGTCHVPTGTETNPTVTNTPSSSDTIGANNTTTSDAGSSSSNGSATRASSSTSNPGDSRDVSSANAVAASIFVLAALAAFL
eukprot:TRINITY_DN4801_c0_g1_i1.p1 TRINITY_DN4801_c0_g1~~TRINITY_DN4801_c0_g1_i1.p1  ORF type:complete len:346 (-),score=45.98 TRINITY_DN4801_c0_g1_i1:47-1084(-)